MRANKVKDTVNFTVDFTCDNPKHDQGVPAFGLLAIHFWYGSDKAMQYGSLHLCDECANNVIQLLEKELKIKNFLKPIEEI